MIANKKLIVSGIQMKYNKKYTQAPVVIELLPYAAKAEAARRWQELEKLTNNTNLTNSWAWIETWLAYHVDILQCMFVFGLCDNQVIGATVVVQATYKRKRISITRIHVGTGKYVEYNRLLVVPAYQDSFAQALIKALQRRFRWSELHIDGFVPEDADVLLQAGKKAGLHFEVQERKTPIFDFRKAIDDGYQDVLSSLGKNTRYHVRRSTRLFEEFYGQVTIEWAENAEQAKDILKELIDLHQRHWTRVKGKLGIFKTGAFNKPYLRSYYAGMIDTLKLWPQGSLIVCRVKAGETTLGCIFHYVENGHVMYTKGGIARFEDAKLKPGFITHVICMEECRQRGLIEEQHGNPGLLKYDFLAGDEAYKDSLTNTQGHLVWATAERGFILWLMEKVRIARDMLKNYKGKLGR